MAKHSSLTYLAKHVWALHRGENNMYPNGGTHRLAVDYVPGSVFGELAMLKESSLRQAGIVATTPCTCESRNPHR